MRAEVLAARRRVRMLLQLALRQPREIASLTAPDLDLLLRIARRARMLGRLAVDLRESAVLDTLPVAAQDQLESAEVMATSRSRLARWELDRIVWALQGEQAPPLVLVKGCAYLMRKLPNARGRYFADVDILLPEQDLERMEASLNRFGWVSAPMSPYDQNYYREWTHELPPLVHEEREIEIDLHRNIVPHTSRISPPAQRLLDAAQPLDGSPFLTLSDTDLVLHTMTHLMFDSDLVDKLRDLVDIDDLLQHFVSSNAGFWDELLARAAEMDLERPAFYSVRYARRLLDCPVPDSVLVAIRRWAPPRPVLWLMDQMVPRALYPQHPDRSDGVTTFCCLLLFVRSHWIRMPPWLLAYHLAYKFVVTRFGSKPGNSSQAPGPPTEKPDVPG